MKPTPEEIAREVAESRERAIDKSRSAIDQYRAAVIVALAGERDRLWGELGKAHGERDNRDAELDAAVKLLRDDNMPASWPGSFCTYPLAERCCWDAERGPCYQHAKRAFLARHEGRR